MRLNSLGKWAIAVAALLTLLPSSTCEGRSKMIRGIVTDESATPIPNAFIELSCPQKGKGVSTKSGIDGHFQFEAILYGACKTKIAAPGFSIRVIPISSSDKRAVMDLGKIQLRVSCSGPDVICDEVTPK